LIYLYIVHHLSQYYFYIGEIIVGKKELIFCWVSHVKS